MTAPTVDALKALVRKVRRPFGRRPASDRFAEVIAPLVDERYYFGKYPDARVDGLSAAKHYVVVGWRKGFDPAPWFSSEGYLRINRDTADGRMPPLVHYAIFGRSEGRTIMATEDVRQPAPLAEIVMDAPVVSDLASLRAHVAADWRDDFADYVKGRLPGV